MVGGYWEFVIKEVNGVTFGKILLASWVELFAEETKKAGLGVKKVAQLVKACHTA